jgi:hypothetical protein
MVPVLSDILNLKSTISLPVLLARMAFGGESNTTLPIMLILYTRPRSYPIGVASTCFYFYFLVPVLAPKLILSSFGAFQHFPARPRLDWDFYSISSSYFCQSLTELSMRTGEPTTQVGLEYVI